jgi:hypothetical protein
MKNRWGVSVARLKTLLRNKHDDDEAEAYETEKEPARRYK